MFPINFIRIVKRHAAPVKHILIHPKCATTTATGAILHQPKKTSFGLVGVFFTVVTGLLIGAAISKNIANFLEENELFVPSDDDDDDD